MIFDFSRFQLVYEYFYIGAQTKIIIKLISNTIHKNNGKSTLTSLVACFILGKVYYKTELTKDDMTMVQLQTKGNSNNIRNSN